MVRVTVIFRILRQAARYGFIILIALICIYAALNTITLLLWGDPSIHGEPRMFHPPEIMVLHYAKMVSPALAHIIVAVLFGGLGFFLWFRFRETTRKTLLDHPLRERIVDFIRCHPGCHFSSLARELDINRGTLSYHLCQLTFFGIVQVAKDGGMTRYSTQKSGIPELEQKIQNHRNNPLRNQILSLMETEGTTARTELKRSLDISGPALWYHMQLLMEDGIVLAEQDRQKAGRPVQYVLTRDAENVIRHGTAGSPAAAGFPESPARGSWGGSPPGTESGIHK